jgi:predicted phage gp36 major capsid-like protein
LTREVGEFRAEAHAILERAGNADLAGDDAARFDQLTESIESHNTAIREMEDRGRRAAELVSGVRSGRYSVIADGTQPYGDDEDRSPAVQQRDAASRVLDRAVQDERLAARGAELVDGLMRSGPVLAQSWTQRWAAATGSEAYERAFAKKLADPENGQLTWTAEEADPGVRPLWCRPSSAP